MRRDYLADLEAAYEVYLAAKAQHAPGSPALAHVEKLAGIRPILPRLQVRREQAEQARGGPAAQAWQPELTVALVLTPLCALFPACCAGRPHGVRRKGSAMNMPLVCAGCQSTYISCKGMCCHHLLLSLMV